VDEHSSLRVRRHVVSSVATTFAVVIGLLLMSLADGAPLNLVRPEHVIDLGAGARANHQGDGIALTPQTLARRAASVVPAIAPSSVRHATPPTTAMIVADLVAVEHPNPPTTPPTTEAPPVDPRDGSGQSGRDLDGVRAAHRAHVPHTAHIPQLEKHVAHAAHVKHAAHRKHREHVTRVKPVEPENAKPEPAKPESEVARPTHQPYRGRRSSTSSRA
jgi:hypothetical protein